jgi:hypothetical protein
MASQHGRAPAVKIFIAFALDIVCRYITPFSVAYLLFSVAIGYFKVGDDSAFETIPVYHCCELSTTKRSMLIIMS